MSFVPDCSFLSRALISTRRLDSASGRLAQLLRESEELPNAPHFLQAEFASALRRLEARGAADPRDIMDAWSALRALPIDYSWDRQWVERAIEISRLAGTSKVYDSIYLACAEAYDVPLVTCDARFAAALPASLRSRLELVA